MIIEFVGLPAAGKSTLARQIIERIGGRRPVLTTRILREQYIPGRKPAPLHKLGMTFYTAVSYPRFLIAAGAQLWSSSRALSEKLYASRMLGVAVENYSVVRRYNLSHELVLLDEGVAQRIFTVMIEAQGEFAKNHIRPYVLAMPKPDILIYLKVEPSRTVERMQQRETPIIPRLQHLSAIQLTELLQEAQDLFDTFINCLRETTHGTLSIIELETNDLELASRQLEHWVDINLLDQSR